MAISSKANKRGAKANKGGASHAKILIWSLSINVVIADYTRKHKDGAMADVLLD